MGEGGGGGVGKKMILFSVMKNVGIWKYLLTVESLLEILTNRRSQAFYKLIDIHSVTNVIGESISSKRMSNIVYQ